MTTREQSKAIYCFPTTRLLEQWPPNTSAKLIAEVFGVTRSTVQRWRTPNCGLSIWQADKYAIKLGLHPQQIWTDWYDKQ